MGSSAQPLPDRSALAKRLERVRAILGPGVTLVAVSKTRSVAEVQALYDLGQRDFGENYPQELVAKQAELPGDIRWHFIGHLQRSNVRHIAPFVHLIHGVDSEKLVAEIEKRASAAARTIDVLLQVHIAREETKHGLDTEEVQHALRSWPWSQWSHVRLRGLMGMATFTEDRDQVRREFEGLAALRKKAFDEGLLDPDRASVLSMGMSGDADVAMRAGSTMVRIGTALFGERS
jgi:pyridoxal phosphate enzyme (YggS family)